MLFEIVLCIEMLPISLVFIAIIVLAILIFFKFKEFTDYTSVYVNDIVSKTLDTAEQKVSDVVNKFGQAFANIFRSTS